MQFEEYLRELADSGARLRVSQLQRLSSLTAEEGEKFAAVWLTIGEKRRRRVIAELVSLAEDNVELNFDRVFFVGLDDPYAEARLEAVRGLWEYEGHDLIKPLLRLLLEDEDARVRAEAALALGRFVLLSEHGNLRERYFQEVEAGLRQAVEKATEVDEVRARALEAMGASGRPWVREAIREVYESGVPRLRVGAIHAMGRSCEPRWMPWLVRELVSEDAEARYEAAKACGSIADERAVPHLAPLLADPDPEVKEAAISVLGEIGGKEARAHLLRLAGDLSANVREAAQSALAELGVSTDPMGFRYEL